MIKDKFIKVGQVFTGSPETTGSICRNTLKIIDIYKDKNTGREMLKVQATGESWKGKKFTYCEIDYFKRLLIQPKTI